MPTVTSADGTRIAYDRHGDGGPAMIRVGGALSYRKFKKFEQIAPALSEHCTVINYRRRGRADSGEAGPVSVEHEVEDIAALIEAVGSRASLRGWSSSGALSLRAGGADIGVEKVVDYETPFETDPTARYPTNDDGARLEESVATGDRTAAAKAFMRNGVGLPRSLVAVMPRMPMFKKLAANGHTLTFDYVALGDHNMHVAPARRGVGGRHLSDVGRLWDEDGGRAQALIARSRRCSRTRRCADSRERITMSRRARSRRSWRSS